jgi:hypothetical protein
MESEQMSQLATRSIPLDGHLRRVSAPTFSRGRIQSDQPQHRLRVGGLTLFSLPAPTEVVLLALAIAVLAILEIQRIKTDNSLSQLFRLERRVREWTFSDGRALLPVPPRSRSRLMGARRL